jgi:uncharacterized membrane protein
MMQDNHEREKSFLDKSGGPRGETRVILLILAGWLIAIIGSQLLIWVMEFSITGFWLTELIFFNLPIHFWISGQFLPLWFILLGVLFNIWMDRHESRRMNGSIRFKGSTGHKEEGH